MEEIIIANERKKLPPNKRGLRGLSSPPLKIRGGWGALSLLTVMLLLFSAVILSLPKNAFAFRLPDSDQRKCYQAVSPYSEIPCADTGQDGAYIINPLSYADNGDGTVTDNNTGLMWQKCSVGQNNDASCSGTASGYNWYQASGTYNNVNNPSSLNACGAVISGYNDWRLPTSKELITIVDHALAYPGPTINSTIFPNTLAWGYWTSTLWAGGAYNAWRVSFNYGDDSLTNVQTGWYVRCVRGGQTQQSLVDNGDGTVTDNRTGLVWQQGEPGTMTWGSALTYCEDLSLAGSTDWRLPNIKELQSLVDETRRDPSIDATKFPGAVADRYWSSTTVAGNHVNAWDVVFLSGYFEWTWSKGAGFYVRCVRSGYVDTSTISSATGQGDVTVTTSALGCGVSDVRAVNPPADPSYNYPYGLVHFMSNCNTATITFPGDITGMTYRKHGLTPDDATPHWYDFMYDETTGAEINGNQAILHFVDGQRGDDDLTANGVIVDPSGPGQQRQPVAVPTMTEWGMIIFMILAGIGAVYYMRRQNF